MFGSFKWLDYSQAWLRHNTHRRKMTFWLRLPEENWTRVLKKKCSGEQQICGWWRGRCLVRRMVFTYPARSSAPNQEIDPGSNNDVKYVFRPHVQISSSFEHREISVHYRPAIDKLGLIFKKWRAEHDGHDLAYHRFWEMLESRGFQGFCGREKEEAKRHWTYIFYRFAHSHDIHMSDSSIK